MSRGSGIISYFAHVVERRRGPQADVDIRRFRWPPAKAVSHNNGIKAITNFKFYDKTDISIDQ